MYNEKTNTKEYRGAFYDWIRRNIRGKESRGKAGQNTILYDIPTNGKVASPKQLDSEIWDVIHTNHPLWDDLNVQHVPGVLEVARHIATLGRTKSKQIDENYKDPNVNYECSNPEIFEKIQLTGEEIRKTVRLSYAAAEMSDGALEKYLKTEIAADIAEKATSLIVDKILDCKIVHDDGGKISNQFDCGLYYDINSYDFAPRNMYNTGVITSDKKKMNYWGDDYDSKNWKSEVGEKLNYNWLCTTIGACSGNNIKIYTDRYHGFLNVCSMVDNAGQPVFRKGKLLDFPVVFDDAMQGTRAGKYKNKYDYNDGTGVLMVLDPSDVIVNIIRPLTFEITKKSADGIIEITASMRMDATMRHRTSFSYWAFTNPNDAPPVERAALTVALAAPVATDVEDGDYDNYAVVDGLYTGDTAENADAWISTEPTGTTPEYDYANTDTGYFKPGDTVDVTVETDSDFFDGTKTSVLSADGAIAPEDGEEITGNGNTYTVTIPNRENNTLMVHLNRTADGTSATPGDYEIMAVDVDEDGMELPPERKRIVIRRKHQEGRKPAPKRSRRKRG